MPDRMPDGQAPTELGRFLRARREGVRPQDAGLPPGTGSRRTPGLRREEIATLAGVSIDYYTRLERGRETRPSPAVVDALARALRLDDEEHEYLKSLAAQAARRPPVPPEPPSRAVRPAIGMLLAARDLFPDWEQKARGCVAQLRAIAGSDPDAPDLAALVGELLVKSPDFGRLWGRYEVRRAGAGDRAFRHPLVGTMTLAHETLDVNRADGQRLIAYMAAPGTPDHDAMVLLDRAGTLNPADAAR